MWIILQVAIGLVVALDYKNPYLSPYEEYQARILLQTTLNLLSFGSTGSGLGVISFEVNQVIEYLAE